MTRRNSLPLPKTYEKICKLFGRLLSGITGVLSMLLCVGDFSNGLMILSYIARGSS